MCKCGKKTTHVGTRLAAAYAETDPLVEVIYRGQEPVFLTGMVTGTRYGKASYGQVMWLRRSDVDAQPHQFEVTTDEDNG